MMRRREFIAFLGSAAAGLSLTAYAQQSAPPSPVRQDWLDRRKEPILEPELPIVDPHHHLWVRPGWRYLLEDLLLDTGSGQQYRRDGVHGGAFDVPRSRPRGNATRRGVLCVSSGNAGGDTEPRKGPLPDLRQLGDECLDIQQMLPAHAGSHSKQKIGRTQAAVILLQFGGFQKKAVAKRPFAAQLLQPFCSLLGSVDDRLCIELGRRQHLAQVVWKTGEKLAYRRQMRSPANRTRQDRANPGSRGLQRVIETLTCADRFFDAWSFETR